MGVNVEDEWSPADDLQRVASMKANDARVFANRLRCMPERDSVIADRLTEYYRDNAPDHIKTNVLRAITYHAEPRHLPFFFEAIGTLAAKKRNLNVVYALDSAIYGISWLGSVSEHAMAMLKAGSPWGNCFPDYALAGTLTLLLLKRHGNWQDRADESFEEHLLQFSNAGSSGQEALKIAVSSLLGQSNAMKQELVAKVNDVIAFRLSLIGRSNITPFHYHPRYTTPTFPALEARFADRVRGNPALLHCRRCGCKMTTVTARCCRRYRACPRCIYLIVRRFLANEGIPRTEWQNPPRGSPISFPRREDGPSLYEGRKANDEYLIRMNDLKLTRIRQSGTTLTDWHNAVLGLPLAVRRKNGKKRVVLRLSKKMQGAARVDARMRWHLWWAEQSLAYETDERWLGERATLNIISDLINERPLRQWSPAWLINPCTGSRLYVDGFYPGHNLAVEHHGHQHYSPVELFGGEASFVLSQQRDVEKASLLKQHGVTLLVVPYFDADPSTIRAMLEALNVLTTQ